MSRAVNATPENVWFTTGFMAILACLHKFNDVSIFGFGYKSEANAEKRFKYHSIYVQDEKKSDHDLVYEHSVIDTMERMNKLKRLESERQIVS